MARIILKHQFALIQVKNIPNMIPYKQTNKQKPSFLSASPHCHLMLLRDLLQITNKFSHLQMLKIHSF